LKPVYNIYKLVQTLYRKTACNTANQLKTEKLGYKN